MSEWNVHIFGRDPELDKVVQRRFGRDHDKPCNRPTVLTCALWECQAADRCQIVTRPTPTPDTDAGMGRE